MSKIVHIVVYACDNCPYMTTSTYYRHCNKTGHKRIERNGKNFPDWCPLEEDRGSFGDWLNNTKYEGVTK